MVKNLLRGPPYLDRSKKSIVIYNCIFCPDRANPTTAEATPPWKIHFQRELYTKKGNRDK
jgi:hypothetical protein